MPRKPRVNREQIVDAAIQLINREGLEAFTMAKLGAELGVEAMSLYNHFSNKGELLDEIAEVAVANIKVPQDYEDWEDFIRNILRSVRQLACEHPNLFPMVLERVPNLLAEAHLIEAYLKLMRSAGFSGEQSIVALQVLAGFTIGYALSEIRGFVFQPGRSGLNARELSPKSFPEIRALAPYFESVDRSAEFEAGLDLVLASLRMELEKYAR
jgi:TetR/AcrR family tetracycline transcriptional repressor